MELRELSLQFSYESRADDMVQEFYIPVLECAVSYDRIAGFFSSTSLAIASQGIAALILNGGHMRLLASPELSREDGEILQKSVQGSARFFEEKLLDSLEAVSSEFERDHLEALGWMLEHGYLELKLVQLLDEDGQQLSGPEIFHQKIGIITDSRGEQLSFSGSINETAMGWLGNIEEFKVFRTWLPGQAEFVAIDQRRFADFWEGRRSYTRVSDLPTAVREKLITYGRQFERERFLSRHYCRTRKSRRKSGAVDRSLSLFPYQKEAVEQWSANGGSLFFEMATGTGKTRTALACVNRLVKRYDRLIVIIACPEGTLARQWQRHEVEPAGFEFDLSLIADGTNRAWRSTLSTALRQLATGYIHQLVIYTTHATGAGEDFIRLISDCPPGIPICFVGDEAHGLGAAQRKKALLERYQYRIGLSATPERWFDDLGTAVLRRYFGGKTFEFTISDALTTFNPLTKKPFLVNYSYNPIFVRLSEGELEEYMALSRRISGLSRLSQTDERYQLRYEKLVRDRASLHKNAESKLPELKKLLTSLGSDTENLLLFVSPEQLPPVMLLLKELGIPAHRFTEQEGTRKLAKLGGLSQREYILEHFRKNTYHALVAISCLDEGIDIPSADKAILLSNSTNPREYIQRIGRVIRQAPGKRRASIYDFIVAPGEDSRLPP